PLERPHIPSLKKLGFTGADEEILSKVQQSAPHILASCSSASSMWVANAATVSPSADTKNRKTHFTPANLSAMYHRSIEHPDTGQILKAIFKDPAFFEHHSALPAGIHFSDEGAANHTRLHSNSSEKGLEIFTFGQSAFNSAFPRPAKFPARQTLEASETIARLHGLDAKSTLYVQQNPDVIDAGVFHNDVIAVGSQNCLFFHEDAFLDKDAFLKELGEKYPDDDLCLIEVSGSDVTVEEAVSTYLFNTQLVSLPGTEGALQIIAPMECREHKRVHAYLEKLLTLGTPVRSVTYIDVRESMRNGGGPACLRLRVCLNSAERESIKARVFMDDALYQDLKNWVETHYRDRLAPADLADPKLLEETRTALSELTGILQIGPVYPFQDQ
ncbi:MAG: N-succinylarginine dihydrolase, partial [Sneathiellales bacterium]|nr:N-succinylarginine dihydrolase [Sneathiellales bacterium]